MARLKFLLFSLLILSAWAAHLYLLSPKVSAQAVMDAADRANAAPAAISAQLAQRRLDLQRAALKVASTPEAMGALQPPKPGRIEAPTAEKLAAVKALLHDSVAPALKKSLVVVLSNAAGTVASRGDEAASDGADLDVAAIAAGGTDGAPREAYGEAHVFYSFPVTAVEKGEAKVVGTVLLGAPVLTDDLVESAVKQTGVGGLGLVRDGKVIQAGGAQKAMVEQASAKLVSGESDVFARGEVAALGPLKLPILTEEKDALGGGAPLWVASRQTLASSPYDVVTLSSVAPSMSTLAEYQKLAVFAFGGIFGLSLVFMLIMGGGGAKAPKAPKAQKQKDQASPPTAKVQEVTVASGPPPPPDLPPPPDATPDDFPFGDAPPPAPPAAAEVASAEAAEQDWEQPPPPPPPPMEEPMMSSPAPMDQAPELEPEAPTRARQVDAAMLFAQPEPERTAAYPANADPFALAAQEGYGDEGNGDGAGEFNPEATRVAMIPEELLRASAQRHDVPAPARVTGSLAPPPVQARNVVPAQDPEETHFQSVFNDFVKTREQCGEVPDGLTYEKFAVKLRKNKEQLVAKYSCRTVKFQVYVKEGKAALKATPVKE